MDPASFFLMFVVLLVLIGGAIAYVITRGAVSKSVEDGERPSPRPQHTEVTSTYHEHTDLEPGSSGEVDRVSSDREHQDRTP